MVDKRTIKHTLVDASIQLAFKASNEQEPAFVLDITQTDKHNEVSKHSIAMSPAKLQGLCAMVQRALHRQGFPVPEAPKTVFTKH